jgi:hypothetical protein
MIEYKVEDTQFPNFKSAIIYPTEDIKNLFIDISINDTKTKKQSTRVIIQVPEAFIRQISEKTGIEISDRVAQGIAPGHSKYLALTLDKNIGLLHAEREK